jgi:hypothetical protein
MRWLNPLTWLSWFWERVKKSFNSTVERLIWTAIVAAAVALLKWRHDIPEPPGGDTTIPLRAAVGVPVGLGLAALLFLALLVWAIRRKRRVDTTLLRTATYGNHVTEILYALERVLSDAIPNVDVENFIENGILTPARDYLMARQDDDVRLSILKADRPDFVMPFAAGHRIASKAQFRLPIAQSFSRWAYNEGLVYWSSDLENDDRYTRHPRADQERDYQSIISVPIRSGAQTVAVFNTIFTPKNAFDDAELLYVRLLGAVIELVWELGDVEGQHGGVAAWPAAPAPIGPGRPHQALRDA